MVSRNAFTGFQSIDYRYGFNGKENDGDVKGDGNQYDYGFRIYDPRLGRFLSTDPLFQSYPYYTPFQFAGNNPIKFLDLDGLEQFNPEKGIESDAPSIDPKYRNVTLDRSKSKPDVIGRFGVAMLKTLFYGFATITEIFDAAHRGSKVPKEKFAEEFPLIPNDNLGKDVLLPMITSPIILAREIKKDPTNPELWGQAAGIIGGVFMLKGGSRGAPPDIALGLNDYMGKNPLTGKANPRSLKVFAGKADAYAHYDWSKQFGSLAESPVGFDDIFSKVIEHVTNGGGRIKFDLTNIDLKAVGADAGKSYLNSESVTNWELNQIMDNPAYKRATDFYRDGKPLSAKELNKFNLEYKKATKSNE